MTEGRITSLWPDQQLPAQGLGPRIAHTAQCRAGQLDAVILSSQCDVTEQDGLLLPMNFVLFKN